MKDYQNDKFENFYLNLKGSRDTLVAFADFTATAVAAPGIEGLIAGHGPALAEAVAGLRQDMVTRQGQDGGSQSGTSAESTAFAAFRVFIVATDTKVLGPYLFDHATERATYYPAKLGGLTQAPMKTRLTRLTAYTQALEGARDKTVQAQAAPARVLLETYTTASTTKTKARTSLQQTIGELGPAALAVAEALWDVNTAALYVHRRAPLHARQYFDFARLPNRTAIKKPVDAPKTA